MKNFLETIKKILATPKDFFDKDVNKIRTWKEPIIYLTIFTGFSALFLTLHHLKNMRVIMLMFEGILGPNNPLPILKFTPSMFISMFIALLITLVAISFLKYWCAHIFIYLWNKKATYKETFKVLSYSTTPGWIGIPFFVIFSFVLYFALKDNGILYWILTVISGIIMISLEIYSMYLRTIAIAKVQKISKLKAFLAVYPLAWITYFLIMVIIETIVILIFFV